MSVRVGPVSILDELPQSVRINGQEYIVNRDTDGSPVLFSSECPHQGGTVEVVDDECLRCPVHNWEFDPKSGDSTTVSNESLPTYEVYQMGDYLFADISQPNASIEFSVPVDEDSQPTINLLSHATLSIEYDGFRLVTNPWLDGPAFLDGWTPYPPPTCDVNAVASDTDAIWITHEHPDHLNPRTLDHFPDITPIYVPELNYRRLSTRLHDLGFENVHSLPTDEPYLLTDNVEAICFESTSTWNDSILALNCGGFRILNINDAGINWEVNRAIPTVDLVATGFAFGASGYPITWGHLDVDEKKELIRERNKQQLQQCEQLVDMFNADYLLPFAKFFELVQPEHKPYRELLEKNRPRDVTEYLDDRNVEVIDIIPGESWDGESNTTNQRAGRERFFDEEFKEGYLRRKFDSFEPIVSESFDLTHQELATYFEELGGSELADEIEDFALTLVLTGDGHELNALIRICDGDIKYRRADEPISFGEIDVANHVRMACPGELVQFVVRNDRSWDDIHVGYWCEFDREPDEYNLGFWRLLHAPWEAREDTMRIAEGYDIETGLAGTAIADLVEKEEVQNLLSTYGLHCAGCPQGLGEDIVEAARIHGLNPGQARQLISEVEKTVLDTKAAND